MNISVNLYTLTAHPNRSYVRGSVWLLPPHTFIVCTTRISQYTSAVCVATPTTQFTLYAQLVYRSIPLRSVCYFHHTIFIVCPTRIPQYTPASNVDACTISRHSTHFPCMFHLYPAVYCCLRYVWNTHMTHTRSCQSTHCECTYILFVYRSILLSAVCAEHTHDTHTVMTIHTL